jgi:hypothetical protein
MILISLLELLLLNSVKNVKYFVVLPDLYQQLIPLLFAGSAQSRRSRLGYTVPILSG